MAVAAVVIVKLSKRVSFPKESPASTERDLFYLRLKVCFSIIRTHVVRCTTQNSDSTSNILTTKALDKMTCYHTLVLILLFTYERPKRDLLLSRQVSF